MRKIFVACLISFLALLIAGCATAPEQKHPPAPSAITASTDGTSTHPIDGPAGPSPTSPATVATPPAAKPTVTTAVAQQPPATIIGSEQSSTLLDNFTAYVAAVDNQEIAAGRQGWAEPVILSTGQHRLTVGFVRGVFNATATLDLTAQSGAVYELRHQSDAQIYGNHSYCEFWVANKNTGEKVTGVVRVGLERLKK